MYDKCGYTFHSFQSRAQSSCHWFNLQFHITVKNTIKDKEHESPTSSFTERQDYTKFYLHVSGTKMFLCGICRGCLHGSFQTSVLKMHLRMKILGPPAEGYTKTKIKHPVSGGEIKTHSPYTEENSHKLILY